MSDTPVPTSEKIYENQFGEPGDRLEAYADLAAIVRQLRRDCPWDREQTHESVKHLLIEEAYEVVSAIEARDWEEMAEELGDVLLHVLFHATIAEEGGRFTIADVIEAEREKLVRRHPHVFGDQAREDADEVVASWEEIKKQEREEESGTPASVLDGVPEQLPALLRAHRVQDKAAGVGFAFPDRADAWAKVEEEIAEFRETLETEADPDRQEDELGDVLFALVNYVRYADLNPENALRQAVDRFTRRFQHVERRVAAAGTSIDETDLSEMQRLWQEAKAER